MIDFVTIFIIFIAMVLIVLIKNTDDWAIEYEKKIKIDTEVTIEAIKKIRKSLIDINEIFRFLKDFKGFKIYNLLSRCADVLSIILVLYPAKKKIPLLKRLLSVKFLKTSFSLFQSLAA